MKQHALAAVMIRRMILEGELAPGQRVAEAALAEQLGLSRTPVRQALPALEQEGLLVQSATRGYVVRSFSAEELLDAMDIRGALEGLAARAIAERGASRGLIRLFKERLEEGDGLLSGPTLPDGGDAAYGEMNDAFHALLVGEAGRFVVTDLIERLNKLAFVSPASVALDRRDPDRVYSLLVYAHRQHHAVVQAIENGEGARAENLMREHVNTQKDAMNFDQASALISDIEMRTTRLVV